MSAVVTRIAKTLTLWEAERLNLKWPDAREAVARQAGVAPGALRRLENGTLKFVERIGPKLDGLFLKVAERKIDAIKHEMALARARGDASAQIDIDAFEAALATARRALGHHRTEG
jgi:hypothetical protein